MKRKGELQFEHTNRPDLVSGWAWNERGDVVAQATIEKPYARTATRTMAPEELVEPSGQMKLPIKEGPAKVSWALANKEGRAAAAPHQLIAAMTEHYGLGQPVADQDLTDWGSRMARSAAKRGLITGHPRNPTMEANVSNIYPGPTSEGDIRTDLEESYRSAHLFRGTGVEKFSAEQMGRAAKRVFARKPKPGERKSQGTQGTLF